MKSFYKNHDDDTESIETIDPKDIKDSTEYLNSLDKNHNDDTESLETIDPKDIKDSTEYLNSLGDTIKTEAYIKIADLAKMVKTTKHLKKSSKSGPTNSRRRNTLDGSKASAKKRKKSGPSL